MTWTIDPTKFAAEVAITHRDICVTIATLIHERIVLDTPVDTGAARTNWLASVGTPDDRTIPAAYPDNNECAGVRGPNYGASVAAARAIIATAGQAPVIFVQNSLEYIQELNTGTSRQAPRQFVEIAIEAATRPYR